MKLSVRTLVLLTSAGAGAWLIGGVASAAQPAIPPSGAPAEAAPAPEGQQEEESPPPAGLVGMIDQALADVDLKPEQQAALGQFADQIEPAAQQVDKARVDLLN